MHERTFDEHRDTEYEVRGNGGNNRNEKVLQLMADNKVITVCPEQMGGLPTPRVPAEIVDGVVTAKNCRIWIR